MSKQAPSNSSVTIPISLAEKALRVGVFLLLLVVVFGCLWQTINSVRAENLLRQGRFLAANSPTSNKRLQFILDALKLDSTNLEARQDLARFMDNQTKIRFQNNQFNLIKEDELLKAYDDLDLLINSYPYQPRILTQKADLANILSVYYLQLENEQKVDFYSQEYFRYNFQSFKQLPKPLLNPAGFNLDVLIASNNVKQFAAAAEVLGFTTFSPGISPMADPRGRQICLNTWVNLQLYPLFFDQLFVEMKNPEQQLPLIQRFLFPLESNEENRLKIIDLLSRLKQENLLSKHGEIYLKDLSAKKPTLSIDQPQKASSAPSLILPKGEAISPENQEK